MKSGRTLQELAVELERQAQSKKDYLCYTNALQARVTNVVDNEAPPGTPTRPVILLDGINGGMPLKQIAHEQLATTLQIPRAYYDRLMSQAPDLLCKNVNHWLQVEPSRKMVRTLDGQVRAILSDRYRPLDNIDLAEAILPQLHNLEGQVISGEVTDKRLYIKAVTPRIQGQVRVGDDVQAGIVISNSEVGFGSLSVEEMTYRLVCLNGAIHAKMVRKTHVGRRAADSILDLESEALEYMRDETRRADDRAFWLKVNDAVSFSLTQERLDSHLEAMRGATERKIEEDPVKVVEVVSKNYGLGDSERGSILKHLIQGADLSAFGLANAVTRASQDVEDYEKATDLESLGGRIIEMPKKEWESLINAERALPYREGSMRQKVYGCLTETSKTVNQLCSEAGVNVNGIKPYLDKLAGEGKVVRDGAGYRLAAAALV